MNWDIRDVQLDGQHTALSLAAALSTRQKAFKKDSCTVRETVKLLLDFKADMHLPQDKLGSGHLRDEASRSSAKGTALMTAARFGNHEVVPLLAAGAA